MRTGRWGCTWLCVAVLLGAAGGCGGVRPLPVTGVVMLDGQPVAGAVVDFQPTGESGRPATGMTDEDGTFRLATQLEDGAFPGQYKVLVTKTELDESARKKTRKSLLPAAYGSASTTPLSCTVPPPGAVILELKKKS